jgi:chemotaxis protein methyltransferase CheR
MQEIHIIDIRKLTDTIKAKYDYDFTNYAISSFKRRIARIIDLYKLNSVDALTKKIAAEPVFFEEFVSEITVNVTEMFRDPSFWRIMRDKIIPNILLNHHRVSIWHAGCSSGEEVYSMAILLKEMGILQDAKIIATDIDNQIGQKVVYIPLRAWN